MAPAEGIDILHVLIAYRGARRAIDVERTREQAQRLAEHLLARAKADEPMDEIATAWSDEPYGRRHAGRVSLPETCLFPPFASAYQLAPGAFAEVVESEYGFHLFQRIR